MVIYNSPITVIPLFRHLDLLPLCKHTFPEYYLFWPFAFILTRFLLSPSRAPVLHHSLSLPSTSTSITYQHFHSFSFAVYHHFVQPLSTSVAIFSSSSLRRG